MRDRLNGSNLSELGVERLSQQSVSASYFQTAVEWAEFVIDAGALPM